MSFKQFLRCTFLSDHLFDEHNGGPNSFISEHRPHNENEIRTCVRCGRKQRLIAIDFMIENGKAKATTWAWHNIN